jgi:undecaprenyl-diphosphatase
VGLAGVAVADELGPAAVVLNPGAGGAEGLEVPTGVRVRRLTEGEDLRSALEQLVDDGAAVVGAVGGDGSACCAAEVAVDRDRVLWVIPGGTLNHFARELGLETMADASEALERRRVAHVDLGVVNAGPFLNNASLGAYGELVRQRDLLRRRLRLGKRPALVLAVARTIRRARPLALEVDGRPELAFIVFVGNNPYDRTGLGGRSTLQSGRLDVRILRARGRWPRLGVMVDLLTGRLERSGRLWRSLAPEVVVRLRSAECLARDGEVEDVSGELRFRSRPGALRVIAPSAAPGPA